MKGSSDLWLDLTALFLREKSLGKQSRGEKSE
ncbi:hypothetical protein G3A_01050 [Bacillus sp. 17376]|nr:hypothetical protein G3A_01050 [Bacillus sp. 17376]